MPIFIAGEWGTLGVIGIMLIYMVIAFTGFVLLPWRSWYQDIATKNVSIDIISATTGLVALTFAFSSIYMILANYDWFPFTGKNIYLFGLDSGGDIIESFFLLAILAYGAAILRDNYKDCL